MASSSPEVSPPQPKSSSHDGDDDDEEIEYEEIEEEIEVEEEVEEEVDEEVVEEDDDSEIGQDLTPVHQENQEHGTSQGMELEEPQEFTQLGPVTKVVSVPSPSMDILTKQNDIGNLKTSESNEKEELQVNGEGTSRETGLKALYDASGEMNHARKTHYANTALLTADASREKNDAIISVKAEANHDAIDVVGNLKQMSPRLHIPQIRLRDPFSSVDFDGRETKKLRIVCEFHAKGWCIKGNSCRFLHTNNRLDVALDRNEALEREASSSACFPTHHGSENQQLDCKTKNLVSHQDGVLGNTHLVVGGRSYEHDMYRDNLGYHPTPFVKGHSIERSNTNHDNSLGFSAVETTMKDVVGKKNGIVHDNYRTMNLPYAYSRLPLSFGTSWNIDALGTRSHLENRLEHRASVSSSTRRNMSPISGSKSEVLSRNHVFGDAEPTNYKDTISSYDWEPSVPFRPSHVITRNLLMKENLYDSLSEGIEQKDDGNGVVKFSYADQGSYVRNGHKQSNCLQEEEIHLKSACGGGTVKDNMLSSSSENKMIFDLLRHETELKVDGCDKIDETEVDLKRDGYMQNESKVLKYFQAALIEYVKELVKPTWRDGLLSKDAHKLIVKKAVDKVISTLQPNQIPGTSESVKLYLSSSKPKLAKLVEGYIDKYGKC